jgi:chlorite dismutase
MRRSIVARGAGSLRLAAKSAILRPMSDTPRDHAASSTVSSDAPAGAPGGVPGEGEGRAGGLPTIDVNEYGGKKDGVRQSMNRRLFMQLLVLEHPSKPEECLRHLAEALGAAGAPYVLYRDANHPRRVGLLSWAEDPAMFVTKVRPATLQGAAQDATVVPSFTMIGRTYATGHEPKLEHVLLQRPIENVLHTNYVWHVWYPLRRTGAFAALAPHDQSIILREHANIGMAYGQQELAHDIRLACHGIDAEDNEFVIGLVGHDLHPLSHLVQTMRKTKQTSEYIQKMGPFFVGHVAQRSG